MSSGQAVLDGGAESEGERRRLNLGSACKALSLSPDQRLAAVCGRDVFKIINTENAFAVSQHLDSGRRNNLTFSSNDVQWHPQYACSELIASAATNARVVVWNLQQRNYKHQQHVLTDHTRAVNRVCWHPSESTTLLSSAQDGTVRLWDLRQQNKCKIVFSGRANNALDVAWCPSALSKLAAAYDDGTVLVWDVRRPGQVETKLQAHFEPVWSIAWHPTLSGIIATASRDHTISVWNLWPSAAPPAPAGAPTAPRSPSRRARSGGAGMGGASASSASGDSGELKASPTCGIKLSSAYRIAWRPETTSRGSEGATTHTAFLASCANVLDCKIHVWDLRSAFVPVASCAGHADVVTGFCWRSDGRRILSVSEDGVLVEHDIRTSASHPQEHLRTASVSWSPRGEIAGIFEHIERGFDSSQRGAAPGGGRGTGVPPPPSGEETRHFLQVPGLGAGLLPNGASASAKRRSVSISKFSTDRERTERFVHLAKNYRVRAGHGNQDPFLHNARVAASAGATDLAHMWKILSVFFSERGAAAEGGEGGLSAAALSLQPAPPSGVLDGRPEQHGGGMSGDAKDAESTTDGQMRGRAASDASVRSNISQDNECKVSPPPNNPGRHRAPTTKGGTKALVADDYSGRPAPPSAASAGGVSLFSTPPAAAEELSDSLVGLAMLDGSGGAAGGDDKQLQHALVSLALDQNSFELPGDMVGLAMGAPGAEAQGDLQFRQCLPEISAPPPADPAEGLAAVVDAEMRNAIVRETLTHAASSGDVQTCAVVCALVSPWVDVHIDWRTRWVYNYSQLLRKHELYAEATALAKGAEGPVSQINSECQVSLTCSKCQRSAQNPDSRKGEKGYICKHCRTTLTKCSICHLTVRGLYIWCQGCGHGGHFQHMMEWFQTSKFCPAGCLHHCASHLVTTTTRAPPASCPVAQQK